MIRLVENYRMPGFLVKRNKDMDIFVYADWKDLGGPQSMGVLSATQVRGKEVFSFAYDRGWLAKISAFVSDPDLWRPCPGVGPGKRFAQTDV